MAGSLSTHTPSPFISHLVVFILSILYPVAAKLSYFVMEATNAQSYLSYLFVQHGTVLNSRSFSLILQSYMEKYFGHPLNLPEYHQVTCSMLCCLTRADFATPDDDDHDLAAMFTSQQIIPLIVHPLLASRIQPLFPGTKPFSFTSHQQVERVQSCLTSNLIMTIMPTGSRKSLAFFRAPLLNPSRMFIVVTPFVALTNGMPLQECYGSGHALLQQGAHK